MGKKMTKIVMSPTSIEQSITLVGEKNVQIQLDKGNEDFFMNLSANEAKRLAIALIEHSGI